MIADDLTGANDTGYQFARYGLQTSVRLNFTPHPHVSRESAVEVLNLDSRALAQKQAYERTQVMLSNMQLSHYDLVYKKIDSTLRGNLGAEINALMDLYPFKVAVVVPAYPAHGRYTIGGYHLVRQNLLEDSEAAHDPLSPMRESFIPSILARQTKRRIGQIEIDTIRQASLTEKFATLLGTGHEILVFDSAIFGDLETIARELLEYQGQILWVGSAGLAQALAKNLIGDQPTVHSPKLHLGSNQPVLIIAGSLNEVSSKQVKYLAKQKQAEVVYVPAHILIGNGKLDPYINEATSILKKRHNLVITILQSEELITGDKGDASQRIVSRLGEIAWHVILNNSLAGVVLTGGDTALATCKKLDITGLKIIDQVEEGIPITLAVGSDLYQGPIVTKAGGFGQVNSLLNVIWHLKKEEEQPHE